jgi:large subunit ribosomal protein L10
MDNPRPEKVAVVQEVRERLGAADAAILTEYRGLKVSELATLRRALREAGGEYRIYKNTLARLAVRELGMLELEALLEGPTAIAFIRGDPVGVAKALRDFGRTNPNLVVKGGLLGPRVLTERDAAALAEIPPREVLLARLAGALAAPLAQMAGLLQALPRNLAYGLKALIDQRGGAPEPAPVAEAAPPEPAVAAAEAVPVAEVEPPEPAVPAAEAEPPEPAVPAAEAEPAAETSQALAEAATGTAEAAETEAAEPEAAEPEAAEPEPEAAEPELAAGTAEPPAGTATEPTETT